MLPDRVLGGPEIAGRDRLDDAAVLGDEVLVEKGALKAGARVDKIRALMAGAEYAIGIDLGLGRGRETVWTSDLSEEYVRINGKYTT